MDKLAAYRMILSTHPLWEKEASAATYHALGTLGGGALGAGAGYLSSSDPDEKTRRALIGGAIGATGGSLAPLALKLRRRSNVAPTASPKPSAAPTQPSLKSAPTTAEDLAESLAEPHPIEAFRKAMASGSSKMYDPAPDLPFRSATTVPVDRYKTAPDRFKQHIHREFDDHLRKYRGYNLYLENVRQHDLPEAKMQELYNRLGTKEEIAAPVIRPFMDDYIARTGQLAEIAAEIARRPEYADVVRNMENINAKPGDFLSDLARDISKRDAARAFQ